MKKEKFKGYDVVDSYPEDGGLKGYFYVHQSDIKQNYEKPTKAYRDIGFVKHRDYVLHLLDARRGEKVLDVGCARGTMMVYSGLLGAEAYGVDICKDSIERANGYLDKFSLKGKAVVGDARKIEFADNYFDKVISSDFFEHLNMEDNIQVLKEIRRVLKPNGIAVIKTPNLTYLKFSLCFKMIKRALQFKDPFKVGIAHTDESDGQHIGLLTKNKMIKIIKSSGFLNFSFYFDANSKIEKMSFSLADLLARIPLLKNIFSEDLIVLLRKPIALSFFP